MDDQELKDLWRKQKIDAASPVDTRAQIEAMQMKMAKFHHGLNRACLIELGIRAFIMVVFGVYFFTIEFPVTRIGALIVIAGELFVSWELFRGRKRAEPDAGAPVAVWLKQEREWLRNWVHDAKPFRTAFWEDLLPLWPGVNVFVWGFPQVGLGMKIGFTVGYTLILAASYLLNKYWRPKKALPLENELGALLQMESQGSTGVAPPVAASAEKRDRTNRAWIVVALLIAVVAVIAAAWSSFNDSWADPPFREPGFDDVSAFGEGDVARIDAWLQEQIALAQYPSLSVAIVRDGKIVYQGIFGFEDMEAGRKATPETSYHVASVTKAFTGSLAVLLDARGVIGLDEPVVKYLPKDVPISTRPEVGATITLRQLASHTSGLPRGIPGRVQSVEGRYELEPERLYQHLAEVRLEFDPGTGELYSNLGFGLLGHALERAAGEPFERLLQEMLCEPLGLERTSIHANDKLHIATGYSSSSTWRRPEKHSYRRRLAASGGLIASAPDLGKFLAAQMNEGIFSNEMLAQLHTPTKLADGSMGETALGWSIEQSDTVGRILEKNGGRNDCSAWIGFAPEHRVGVALVTNCGEPEVEPLGFWLLERSVPGGRKPVTKYGYAKVAPYSGVRWKNNRPIVRVDDRWFPLVSIDGIPITRIMDFAEQEFGGRARKRFAEDLVELLSRMGHPPEWTVTMGLEKSNGQTEALRIRMTERNRSIVRKENAGQ